MKCSSFLTQTPQHLFVYITKRNTMTNKLFAVQRWNRKKKIPDDFFLLKIMVKIAIVSIETCDGRAIKSDLTHQHFFIKKSSFAYLNGKINNEMTAVMPIKL